MPAAKLYFTATDSTGSTQLYVLNAAGTGASVVKNLGTTPGIGNLRESGGYLYFTAVAIPQEMSFGNLMGHQRERLESPISPPARQAQIRLTYYHSMVCCIFSANDGISGIELWALNTNDPPIGSDKTFCNAEDIYSLLWDLMVF